MQNIAHSQSLLSEIPAEVKTEEAGAEYRDGILTVTVPKAEQSKGRKIDIQ